MKTLENNLKDVTGAGIGRILSRSHFFHLLDLEVKRARRYQNFLCLLLVRLKRGSEGCDGSDFQTCSQLLNDLLTVELRESDILGALGEDRLVALLPYADDSAGGLAKSRFENILKYFSFDKKGFQVAVEQICFPINGADTIDLIKKTLSAES